MAMNEALALTQDLGTINVGEMLAFPRSISKDSAQQMTLTAAKLMRSVSSVLDDLVLSVLDKRTLVEFKTTRNEVFPKYFEAVRALSGLARIVIPPHVIERLSNEFFCGVESDLRECGLSAFGAEIRDQAIFTVWTLRKISDLCQKIAEAALPVGDIKESDGELSKQFVFYAIWTRFHLDCLLKSMQFGQPVYPEVLEALQDGLRAAVNAYALARRGLDLRTPATEPSISPVDWDEEEQQLLDESTHDMMFEQV